MDIVKQILCRNCGSTIGVSGDVDETDGPEEEQIRASCPACNEINFLMWPKSESGWVITIVRLLSNHSEP